MLKFVIKRNDKIARDDIFSLSTNIEQFSNLMPRYFKSLKIIEKINSDFFVEEELWFFKKIFKVKTKHTIKTPNIHEIQIISGVLKNSIFIENYEIANDSTELTIIVNLKFNGIFKFFYLFRPLIENKINKIMDEFISNCKIKSESI